MQQGHDNENSSIFACVNVKGKLAQHKLALVKNTRPIPVEVMDNPRFYSMQNLA
jgi:hypothetical protein